ncbi:MAG: SRPBCC family protein [Polyangiaceae bacterium]
MAKAKRRATKGAKAAPKKSAKPQKKAVKSKKVIAKKPLPKKSAPKKAAAKKPAPKKSSAKKPAAKKSTPKKSTAAQAAKLVFGIIEQVEHFSASPEVVYRALTDAKTHSAFTGAAAKIGAKVGGAFSAWNGYIKGRILELVPGEKIVQAWRTKDFPREYPDSNLEIRLTPESGGTRLRLLQTNVPEMSVENYHSGWQSRYWQRLRAWLATLPQLELPFGVSPAKRSRPQGTEPSGRKTKPRKN